MWRAIRAGSEIAPQSRDGTAQSLGIVSLALQTVGEAKELIPRLIATGSAVKSFRLGERLLFHGECGLEIDRGWFPRIVPEPQGDDGAVDACLE